MGGSRGLDWSVRGRCSASTISMPRFMQLWLWAKVKMGWRGLGFARNEGSKWEELETNIVVMKPDMFHRYCAADI
jgi:hypothetical protein